MQWKSIQGKIFRGNDRGNRNFGPIGRGSFGRGGQNVSQDKRQNLENNPKGVSFEISRQIKASQMAFQAYDINGKSLLETLKKLAAYDILKQNGPETNNLR